MNINDEVEVILTDYGLQVYNAYRYKTKELNENNILREQLWKIMNIFGSRMYMGNKQCFKDNRIEFKEETDKCLKNLG